MRGEHLVVEIEVTEVVRGDRAELVEHCARLSRLFGERLAVIHEQVGQDVASVESNGAHPRQVVESDLVDRNARRFDVQQTRDQPLHSDGDVAEADGAVTVVAQGPRDDADRIREVDDPDVVGSELPRARRDLEDDRDRSQGFRQAAGAGGLLSDAAARKRHGLVGEACGLPSDAQLHEHERRAVERTVEVVCDEELAAVAGGVEHPPRESADYLAAFGVGIL